MHWVDRGVQFDWRTIAGEGPRWWHFYTANASVARTLLEVAGGFDEDELPFLYEDLDLARRMSDHGLELVYDAQAVCDHLVPVTLESFRARLPRLAASELAFTRRWPEADAYFRDLFTRYAGAAARLRARAAPDPARAAPDAAARALRLAQRGCLLLPAA